MEHDNPSREPVDRDLLVSRVVDDAASPEDWQQLRALAEYDPSVWRELFEAQHAQAELAQAVQQAIAIADGVDAPVDQLSGPGLVFRFRKAAAWSGWGLAASVAIVWAVSTMTWQAGVPSAGPQAPQPSGSTVAMVDPDSGSAGQFEAFNTTAEPSASMLAQPRTLPTEQFRTASAATERMGEMPERVLLEVRPLPDGRMELIYVRRLIEKTVVEEGELYQVKPDDAGIDRAVPYRTRRPSSGPI
jgi:hypothetical protein